MATLRLTQLVATLGVVPLLLGAPAVAQAHAELQLASPAPGTGLAQAPAAVVIKFSELAPAATYTGKVLGFNMITDGPAYDVNIDEATFFKGDAPTGAIMPETGAGGAGM